MNNHTHTRTRAHDDEQWRSVGGATWEITLGSKFLGGTTFQNK